MKKSESNMAGSVTVDASPSSEVTVMEGAQDEESAKPRRRRMKNP